MIAYQYSEELDATSRANSPSFTTLPVRIRKDNSRSQKICAKFLAAWSKIGVKYSSTPVGTQCSFGHFVSLVIPECPPDKIALITKLCDYGFIENDLLETPDLVQVVGHTGPRSFNPKYEAIRQEVVEEMLDIDHPMMMSLMVFYQEYWMAKLNDAPSPSTFEEYIQQRLVHSGFKIIGIIICICMDIRIDPLEMENILHITRPLEQSLGLCNDYFSYAKEKEELRQGKGRNALTFLMQKEGMTEEEALKCLKEKIASLEETHHAAFEDSMKNGVLSPELRQYILFLRMAGGGVHVFHSTAGTEAVGWTHLATAIKISL
ncbi:isoprenoid synthase domain-containing protein [Penicillium canescens]|nr:isoprenoid synthase domain-containing protein [Penicillium canescens]